MNDEVIRKKIINYVKNKGVKYTFIAIKIGVHRSTLCHFLKNDRKVADKVSKNLQEFLLNNK
ncbi:MULTISPECIES: hypothetical protein [Clostridium]|uniref:hypothetical protein n=1 Tax=Clostridium TaxID=1485 RepID=UPI0008263A0C|nr:MULTISPECIES: hypothetical protein [Clostridium]PJI07666.1 hypothetical protein CUB90_07220 [Clostridium sp. CT7]